MKKTFGKLWLTLWTVALSVPVMYFWMFHTVPFQISPLKSSSLSVDAEPAMHHFLSTGCGCSKGVLEYLVKRGVSKNLETVHLIVTEGKWQNELERAGFRVETLTEEDMVTKYDVKSVPQLVVAQNQRILYQGGYNENQAHSRDYRDLEVFSRTLWAGTASGLSSGLSKKEFPLFGCANGKIAKSTFDPLGVK